MTIRLSPRFLSFVLLGVLAAIGIILVLRATPEGLGLSDDSIAYIAGARSMVAGHGYREAWLASNGPVTHFPPAFPSVLAFFGIFGIDPLHAARFVNAFLFGLNAALLGILAWRMTPSLTAGLVLAGLFVLCGDLLQVHAVAMSEPLFIFLSLLSFWMFDLYFERNYHIWLGACATFVGLAYLTRYSGLALLATFVVALLILKKGWKEKLTSTAMFIAGTLPWIIGWTIRNKLVAENATNRTFVWHPITADNLQIGLRTLADAFFPIDGWRKFAIKNPILIEVLIALILGAVLVWLVLKTWNYLTRPQPLTPNASTHPREVISFTAGLYIFAYLASIISSMLMFDAATKFRLRILAPTFVSLLILLIYLG